MPLKNNWPVLAGHFEENCCEDVLLALEFSFGACQTRVAKVLILALPAEPFPPVQLEERKTGEEL